MRYVLSVLLVISALCAQVYAADTCNLVMKAGADFRPTLAWADKTGHPINITGNTYQAEFRDAPEGTLFARYSTVITDAANGKMQLRLSRAQTTRLSKKTGVWDIKQTTPDGQVKYRFGGTVIVKPPVTAP